ncbi:MAG: hypothetical protein U0W24_07415 [Bacteroidales bacterium]
MQLRFSLLIPLLLSVFLTFGQDNISDWSKIESHLQSSLSEKDRQKLKVLAKEEQDASKLMAKVEQNYQELEGYKQQLDSIKDKKKREKILKKMASIEKKTIRDHVAALKYLSDIYVRRYNVYEKEIKKYSTLSADTNNLSEIEKLGLQAYKNYETADLYAQQVFYTVNPNDLFNYFTEAFKLEQLGLLYKQKSIALQTKADTAIIQEIGNKIIAFETNKPEEKDQKLNVSSLPKDSFAVQTIYVHDTIKIEQVYSGLVIYKVQIAASKIPLTKESLAGIYKENSLIQFEIDNNWYKYSVGYFTKYSEAQDFKNRIGVRGAFIVAYKDGKKVPIPDLVNDPSYNNNR